MKLTPLDIKKQEFTRTFRGIDPQEVQGFLDMVADQWGSLLDENRRLEQNLRDMEAKLVHYRKIEEALQEALETARDNSHKTIENAQREAQIILKEARSEAEELRNKAVHDHKRLKTDVSKIAGRRDEIMARLRAFLMSELEILARFEGHDPIGFIRLSASQNRKLESPRIEVDDHENEEMPARDGDDNTYILGDGRAHQPPSAPVQQPAPAKPAVSSPPPKPKPPSEPEPITFHEGPAEQGGLSTDDLDFIKATVSTAAQQVDLHDFFPPAESIEDEPWMHVNNDQIDRYSAQDIQDVEEKPQRFVPRYADSPSPFDEPAANETPRDHGHWVMHPIVTPLNHDEEDERQHEAPKVFERPLYERRNDDDDLTATPEEIEKIRRILNDLD